MAVLMYLCILTVALTGLTFHGGSCDLVPFSNCTTIRSDGRINTTAYSDTKVTEFPCLTTSGTNVCPLWPSKLPNGLSNGSSVVKPRDFDVTMFTDNVVFQTSGLRTCAGAVFTWRVPVDENSRQNTKGYFLIMDRINSNVSNCRAFDIQGFKLDSSKINFRFETFPYPLSQGPATFVASLHSLPPPSQDEMEEGLEASEHVVMTIPVCYIHTALLSAHWTTWIVVKNATAGTVEVSFGFANDSLNFRFAQYHVRLFRSGDTSAPFNETILAHVSGSQTFGKYVFKNVPGGEYFVQVFADDTFYGNVTECLCNEGALEGVKDAASCTACARSQTDNFTVTDAPLTTTPTPTILDTTTTTTVKPTIPQREPEVDGGAVAGAVLGSLAAGAVVAAAAFLCWRRSRYLKEKATDHNENNLRETPDRRVWTMDTVLPAATQTVQAEVPQLRRKRVFLLAAEDHPYHIHAVEMYAEFLRVHCYCDVTFTPQCRAELRGKVIYCWMSGEIEQADFVVIVTSMAAYRLYQAFQKGLSFRDADLGPEGDLFTPGIQHICGMITCNADVQKILMVHFDHTVSDLRLPIRALPSSLYLLPKHLCDFLQHIHGVDQNNSALSKVLPLQCNISQLPEGNAWLSAVQEAKTFERRNPNWFDVQFGKPSEVTRAAPEFTTQESGFYSNEGGSIGSRHSADLQRKLSSVSMVAEHFVSGFEPAETMASEYTITKDDFVEPSMCFSAYTVPPGSTFADDKPPEEIDFDDRGSTTSELLRHLNLRYELDRLEETGVGGVRHYPVVQTSTGTAYNNKGCMNNGVQKDMAHNYTMSPPPGTPPGSEHAYLAEPQVRAFINLRHNDADVIEEDCVSISSAQSV